MEIPPELSTHRLNSSFFLDIMGYPYTIVSQWQNTMHTLYPMTQYELKKT
jgi:hypothetical protein